LLLALTILPLAGSAQNTLERGDVVVHYNALPSTTLSPDVARQYRITRSSNRALLNVSVLRKQADGSQTAIPARIDAAATNLNGQRQDLALREVREGEAIYYLAEPRVTDQETLNFELNVLPEGESSAIQVRFQQQFFASR
jgi:hypothetical protein